MCAFLKNLVSKLYLPIWVCDLEQLLGLTHENSLFKISYFIEHTEYQAPCCTPNIFHYRGMCSKVSEGQERNLRNTCFADWVLVVILPLIQLYSFKYAS